MHELSLWESLQNSFPCFFDRAEWPTCGEPTNYIFGVFLEYLDSALLPRGLISCTLWKHTSVGVRVPSVLEENFVIWT
jgi:hypothetical protein